ncbi:LysR family transcriptional regulator [Rhizobium sp. BR 362]|uniref:LysR family transcriptional regulator n=1 Tax=Rhizobium sp. BR 362 TaxID=3040670 RepID=UPI002F41D02B
MDPLQRRLLPSTTALAAFDSVVRLGSFSAAAVELTLTQAAISRQILTLEERLNTTLFIRGGRGVALTPQGIVYHKSIQEALALIRSASLHAITGSPSATLNLAILPTFGTRWLLPRIPNFVSEHPEVTLNFASRIGVFDFASEGIDAAIYIGGDDWPNGECTFLMEEIVAPVCSPAFLKDSAIVAEQDLLRLPLLQMRSRPLAWEDWFSSLGINGKPRPNMGFEQFLGVAQACIAGLGVALMPLFLIKPELDSGQLIVASHHRVRSRSNYYLVSPEGREPPKPVRAFREWLLRETAEFCESESASLTNQ